MATGEKKGFIARMLEGKERDDAYARSTLPSNRWGLFWDIFKGRFSKLVILNLLMLIFFIPLILVIVFRSLYIQVQSGLMPFASGMGGGFGAIPNLAGLQENVAMSTNLMFGLFIIVACVIAAVGLSGGIYVIRNMVWTEGIFIANDFWRGIKINFVIVMQSTLFYAVMLFLFTMSISWANYLLSVDGGVAFLFVTSQVLSYIAIGVVTVMYLWMLSMGGNYKLKFFQLLKNSFLMTFGLIFQNIFFIALMAIPLILLLLGSFFMMIGIVIMILFGISFMLLVWFDYSQWAFDKFFESKREGGKVNRGIYAKAGKGGAESKAVQEYNAALASTKSELASRPIKPITDNLKVYELPDAFSREDLKKLRESKTAIAEDSERYENEHKNDKKYVEYNAMFEQQEAEAKAAEEAEKGKKSKKSKDKLGTGPKGEGK